MKTRGLLTKALGSVICICISLASYRAGAQTIHETVGRAIVSIEITGEAQNGDPLGKQGTGFLVSPDGYIVTSYHLFKSVLKAKAGSIKIQISIGEKKAIRDRDAYVVDAKENLDVALLKTPSSNHDYPFLKLGTSLSVKVGDTVFVAGFPKDVSGPPQVLVPTLSGKDAPGGHNWILSGSGLVDEGYSGSPVYNNDGDVVGVVKGSLEDLGAFVPVDLADLLISQFRFRDLERRLSEMISTTDFVKRIDAENAKFLAGDKGRSLLAVWLDGYLTAAGGQRLDKFLENNRTRIEAEIDHYMSNVVAYTYSDQFFLGTEAGTRKNHVMPFFKANGDTGELTCLAKYPEGPNKSKTKIRYSLNDQDQDETKIREFGLSEIRDETTARTKYSISADNSQNYDSASPSRDPHQVINFSIDDKYHVRKPIDVQCTLLIVGPAKLSARDR